MPDAPCADLYLAPDGNDRWSGRLPQPNADHTDGPLATIGKAQRLIRIARAQGHAARPVTVLLRGGRYPVEQPLHFGPDDSSNVTFAAYPGEEPVLDGGATIDGFQPARLNGREVWAADVAELVKRHGVFRSLFVNGQRRPRARLPKKGYFQVESVPGATEGRRVRRPERFVCQAGDVQAWKSLPGAEVVILHYFKTFRIPIAGYDEATRTLSLTRESPQSLIDPNLNWRADYFIDNLGEGLREPGEWYLDAAEGKLYYAPMPGEAPGQVEVVAPRTRCLARVSGDPDAGRFVDYLTLRGLTFRHSDWEPVAGSAQSEPAVPGCVHLEAVRHSTIEDCTFERLGFYGLELGDGCTGNRIVGNTLRDLGGGGIRASGANLVGTSSSPVRGRGAEGPPPTLARRTGHNHFTDNHLHALGRVFMAASGFLLQYTFGNRVMHNRIHDLYYTAISVGWTWGFLPSVTRDNRIEFNHCYDIGQGVLSDMAGVYTLGVQPGTTIRGNLIHDVRKRAYGGFGINLDEGSSHIVIEGNVVYNTSSQSLHQHFGRENAIRNNVFAFGDEGIIGYSRGPANVLPEKGCLNDGSISVAFVFERNIVVTRQQPLFIGRLGDRSGDLDTRSFLSDLNVYFDPTGAELFAGDGLHGKAGRQHLLTDYGLEAWRRLGYDRHTLAADPRFRDLARGDFALAPDSPALEVGFQPIDLGKVGPRPKGQRQDTFPNPGPVTW